jgi:hypothetical protein
VTAPANYVNVGDSYTLSILGNTFLDQFLMPNSGVTVDSVVSGQVLITTDSVREPASIVLGLTSLLVLGGIHGVRQMRGGTVRLVPAGAALPFSKHG